MKKIVVMGLVILSLVVMMGCPADDGEEKEEDKVVAEQYRGVFIMSNLYGIIKLTKDTYYNTTVGDLSLNNNDWDLATVYSVFGKFNVWTVGAYLFTKDIDGHDWKLGTFTDVDTFVDDIPITYTRTTEYQ